MLFGKYVNKYYLKYWFLFLIGVLALAAVDVAQTFIPRYLAQIVDENNELIANQDNLFQLLFGIIVCALVMFIGRCIWRLAIFRASGNIEMSLRKEMFTKAEKLSTTYYHDNKVGNVLNWFTSDIETIGEFYGWGTVMLVDAIFLSVVVIVQMAVVNIWMTILALIPITLIVIWGALVEKFMVIKWENRQKAEDRLYDFSQENFTGIRVIKAFVKENKEIHAFAKIAKSCKDINVGFARISVLFDALIEIIIILELSFILGFGGWFIYAASSGSPINLFGFEINITVGMLVQFVGYIDLLIWPMIALGQIVTMRSRAKGSLNRITNFLDAEEDIKNCQNAKILKGVKGKIEFRNFSFKYPSNDSDSLTNVSLTINPGETVGIVGKIGSGKTTLVNVLMRLYNVKEGSIFIDDVDMMKCDISSLRDNIAYAPQDNFLFSDEVKNNISFSSDSSDLEKVYEAATFADVHDNIKGFPNGYETVSGERGVMLSGGQKQRISIARAYYKDAPIMILDDSVSAVDIKTEETILRNIKNQRKGKTTILVASRVSTVMHLDKIIVLENGRLESFGSHEELMSISPAYQKMVYLQELEKEAEGGDFDGGR